MLFIDIQNDIIENSCENYHIIDYRSNNIIDCIIPNKLYIGSVDSNSIHILNKYKITNVICVEENQPIEYPNITYTHFPINERNPPKLIDVFNNVFDIIEKSEIILIYCYKGISRSAIFICAYLMKKYNISFQLAIRFLRDHRKYIDPNISLINEILDYEESLKI